MAFVIFYKQNNGLKSVKVKFPESKAQGADSEAAGGGIQSTSSTVCRAFNEASVYAGPPPGHGS